MQQKYCDHGRSMAVLTSTCPTCASRNCCGSGGKPRNASILPSMKRSIGLTLGSVTQRMSFSGSSPTSEAISVKRICGFEPKAWMPTLFPFRSATVRTLLPPRAMASTRRLAAILAADTVGYSRLMGLDEAGTAQALVEDVGALGYAGSHSIQYGLVLETR